jgi:glycosyltransferase involved in cell wall biosynthesis
MPDYHELDSVEQIRGKAAVHYPGVERPTRFPTRMDGPLTILWSGRWEHDKNPEDYFAAIELLENRKVDFRLNVLGESFGTVPPVFSAAKKQFADKIRRWGYVDRDEYSRALLESDVIVSTANHEYFGIGVVEAICSGVYPLLPRRLSYPELLEGHQKLHLYSGDATDLVEKLVALADRKQGQGKSVRLERQSSLVEAFSRFHWKLRSAEMDQGLISRM